jgi:hypothetical protein
MKPLPEIKVHPKRPALDDRPLERRIGLIILATDHTSEPDFRRMVASERIGVYVARIPYANPTTPENLRKMQPALTAGAALILPDEKLDAICYSCTSASVVIGDAEIEAAIQAAKPGVPVVTPPMAGVRGLNAFGVRRISILTPLHGRNLQADGGLFRGAWIRHRQLHLSRLRGRPRDGAHPAGSPCRSRAPDDRRERRSAVRVLHGVAWGSRGCRHGGGNRPPRCDQQPGQRLELFAAVWR